MENYSGPGMAHVDNDGRMYIYLASPKEVQRRKIEAEALLAERGFQAGAMATIISSTRRPNGSLYYTFSKNQPVGLPKVPNHQTNQSHSASNDDPLEIDPNLVQVEVGEPENFFLLPNLEKWRAMSDEELQKEVDRLNGISPHRTRNLVLGALLAGSLAAASYYMSKEVAEDKISDHSLNPKKPNL